MNVDIIQLSDRLLFAACLKDDAQLLVTTTGGLLSLFKRATDGTLATYDFSDNTFKTGAVTTATLALTHRLGKNSTLATGIYTVALATLTGFVTGDHCIALAFHPDAVPTYSQGFFRYGYRGSALG